jgi:hypothetical protein
MAVATPPAERTRHFSSSTRSMLINGKFEQAASGKTFDTVNPATGEVLASVAEGDAQGHRSRSAGCSPRLRRRSVEPNDPLGAGSDHAPYR